MKSKKLKMNLQFFSDGLGGAVDGGQGAQAGQGSPGAGEGTEVITFASQSEYDSAVDKRINSALETARAKWQKESDAALEQARSEGQRMAGLTAEQKEQEAQKQRDAEIAKREADITRRELRAQSLEQLAEKGLPKELIDTIVLSDADTCLQSIEAVEKAFRSAVEIGVNERLAASANPPGVGAQARANEPGSVGKRLAEKNAKKQTESKFF